MGDYHKQLGNWGERLASRFLQKKGYTIVTSNFCIQGGQLDLIAYAPLGKNISSSSSGLPILVFIEIKTRSANSFGLVEESISNHQKHSLIRTARHFLFKHRISYCYWQFDLISIQLSRNSVRPSVEIKHLNNIFSE